MSQIHLVSGNHGVVVWRPNSDSVLTLFHHCVIIIERLINHFSFNLS